MIMATLIPYRQHDPKAVTMNRTGSTDALARAQAELAAMEGISDLLTQLPDAAARKRVLHWLDAIFRQDAPAPAPMSTRRPLHVVQPVVFRESNVNAPENSSLSVGDLDSLSVEDFDDWFDNDRTPPPDDRLPEPASAQPVVSMIHGFVVDFQKLARDWQED
jgi:hypothetical protein